MANNNLMPAQVLGMEMADDPSADMLRESIPTGDYHTANVEDTSYLPSSPEHKNSHSTGNLAASIRTSEQGMTNNNMEPTPAYERVMVGSSPIEDNKVDLEAISSRTIRPITQDRDFNGLSKQEIIVILAAYRSREEGLASLSKKELLSLLKFYKVSDVLL
jgi:hypothetical protein